jgi:hypothetical protein
MVYKVLSNVTPWCCTKPCAVGTLLTLEMQNWVQGSTVSRNISTPHANDMRPQRLLSRDRDVHRGSEEYNRSMTTQHL